MAEIIKECDNCKHVMTDTESFPCNRCKRNAVDKWEPMPKTTNADKIRSMTDEELADMLHNIGSYVENGNPLIDIYIGNNKTTVDDSFGFILEWLQSEAE